MDCLEWPVTPMPQLVTIGHSVWSRGNIHFSRCFSLYDVLIVRSGCIYMAEDEREYAVRGGHILTLEPGKTHVGYRESEEDTELFWLHILHDSGCPVVAADQIPWSLVLRKGTDADTAPSRRPMYMPKFGPLPLDEAWGLLETMVQLHNRLNVESVLELQVLFVRLLGELQEGVRAIGADGRSAKLARAVAAYLRQHESVPLAPGQLTREFHYHADYIARCLKRHTGMSPLEYVRHVRIAKARQLLEQAPELSIRQIAEMVCMPDANYFARIFRQETGLSPVAYRKRRTEYS